MARVQTCIKSQRFDALVLGNFGHHVSDSLLSYLFCRQLEQAVLIIPARGRATAYAIPFEVGELKKQFPSLRVRPIRGNIGAIISPHVKQGMRAGIHASALPHSVARKIKKIRGIHIADLKDAHKIPSIKLPEEIACLQKAADITHRIFMQTIRNWRAFKTETGAAQSIHRSMIDAGVEPSFPPIVASGKNAAHPHHEPTSTKLQKGFCVIDMGVRYKGYCSDMTRTIYIGRPGAEDRRLYASILHAQEKTIQKTIAGERAKDIDAYCRDLLGLKLSNEFIHGLGHGVGTQVHEWPLLNKRSETRIENGMVVTIEPGVYRQGRYGIRIEDDVLLTKKGPLVLTKTTKKMIIV